MRDGNILQKSMIPCGVEGGTKSRAAERIMTYSTERQKNIPSIYPFGDLGVLLLTIVDQSKKKE